MLFSLQDKFIRKVRLEPYGLKFDQWAMDWIKGTSSVAFSPYRILRIWLWGEAGNQEGHLSHCKFIYFGERHSPQFPFLLFRVFISVYNNDYIIWYYWNWNILNIWIFLAMCLCMLSYSVVSDSLLSHGL